MIKSFREFMEIVDNAENPPLHLAIYHLATEDADAVRTLDGLLNEAKAYVDLGKGRSIMFHKAHVPDGEDHIHFRVKGANIAALNQSGTAHDRSHGIKLQRWALDGAAAHYPDFVLPEDGLIEALIGDPHVTFLGESHAGPLVDPRLMELAEREARNAVG
jgi:hypothetical protein